MTVLQLVHDDTTKTCSKCHEEKSIDRFDKDKSNSSGLRAQCKDCRAEIRATQTRSTKPRAKKPVPTPLTPEMIKKQEASRNAILRLIENHRAEYNKLVYSEQVRSGLVAPGDRPVGNWVSLV